MEESPSFHFGWLDPINPSVGEAQAKPWCGRGVVRSAVGGTLPFAMGWTPASGQGRAGGRCHRCPWTAAPPGHPHGPTRGPVRTSLAISPSVLRTPGDSGSFGYMSSVGVPQPTLCGMCQAVRAAPLAASLELRWAASAVSGAQPQGCGGSVLSAATEFVSRSGREAQLCRSLKVLLRSLATTLCLANIFKRCSLNHSIASLQCDFSMNAGDSTSTQMHAWTTLGLRVLRPICVLVSTDQKRLSFNLHCGLGVES